MQYSLLIKADNQKELSDIVDKLNGDKPSQAPALTGQGAQIQAELQQQQQHIARAQGAPPTPLAPPTPVPQQAYQQAAQTQAPPMQQAPVAQQQPQPGQVATSAPTYSYDDIARAATQLMDMDKPHDITHLFNAFNIQGLYDLPPERYGEFAAKLRELGATF